MLLFEGQSDARGVGGTSSPSSFPKNIHANPKRSPLFCFFPGKPMLSLSSPPKERIFQFYAADLEEEEEEENAASERVRARFLLRSLWNTIAHSHRVCVCLCVLCLCLCLSRARGGILSIVAVFSLFSLLLYGGGGVPFLRASTDSPKLSPSLTKNRNVFLTSFSCLCSKKRNSREKKNAFRLLKSIS